MDCTIKEIENVFIDENVSLNFKSQSLTEIFSFNVMGAGYFKGENFCN